MNCFHLILVDACLTNPCMCRNALQGNSAGREGEEKEEGGAGGRRRGRYQVKLLSIWIHGLVKSTHPPFDPSPIFV